MSDLGIKKEIFAVSLNVNIQRNCKLLSFYYYIFQIAAQNTDNFNLMNIIVVPQYTAVVPLDQQQAIENFHPILDRMYLPSPNSSARYFQFSF